MLNFHMYSGSISGSCSLLFPLISCLFMHLCWIVVIFEALWCISLSSKISLYWLLFFKRLFQAFLLSLFFCMTFRNIWAFSISKRGYFSWKCVKLKYSFLENWCLYVIEYSYSRTCIFIIFNLPTSNFCKCTFMPQ